MSRPAVPASKRGLKEEQLAEIKKVFSIFDKDGDGSISSKELKAVIEKLADHSPSNMEIDQLMVRMDSNKDGVIQWEEFVGALGEWLDEEEKSEKVTVGSKRKDAPSSPMQARQKIHKRISQFFLQFHRAANFEDIRNRLSHSSNAFVDDVSLIEDDANDSGQALSANDKMMRLQRCRGLMDQLPQMAMAITANDPGLATEGVKGIAEILSICDAFRTPLERYEIGDFLMTVFQRVREAGVIPRIAKFLAVNDQPHLQFEAARVISYYAPGPRIAHTPRDSVLHPDKMLHKTEVVHSQAIPVLVQLLQSPCLEVREQAAVALGKIGSHQAEARDFILNFGAFPLLWKQITDSTPITLLRKLTWALSIFCGHTHPREQPPNYKLVSEALPKFAYLIFNRDDEETLYNVCWAMGYLLPGLVLEDVLISRLCMLLKYPSSRLQKAILNALTDLARFDNAQVQQIMTSELLPGLQFLLSGGSNDYSVKLAATELVTIIVGERGHIQAVIDAGLIQSLVALLSDEYTRWKVVKVLSYCTRGIPSHVSYLVEKLDIVKVLSNTLSYFKNYDSVLRDVYQYLGPSYNFRFIHEIVDAMDNILTVGDTAPEGNPYVKRFDMDVIEKMKNLLTILGEELPGAIGGVVADEVPSASAATPAPSAVNGGGVAAMSADTAELSLDEKLRRLLLRIKALHERVRTTGYEFIGKSIVEIIRTFNETLKKNQGKLKKKKPAASPGPKGESKSGMTVDIDYSSGSAMPPRAEAVSGETVTLKLFFNGDNRLMEVPRNITLGDLSLRIQLRYNKTLVIQFEDEDGDKITIDNKELFDRAMSKFDGETGVSSLKLFLHDPAGPAGAAMGAVGDSKADFSGMTNPQQKAYVLSQLESSTHFSRRDLEQLHRQFQKAAAGGRVNKAQFEQGLRQIGIHDKVMIDQFFTAFDHGKDGFIDFREFCTGLSVMYKGTMDERLELAFRAYDLDGNGYIDREELFHILKGSFHARGFPIDDETIRSVHVEKCFEQADQDGDGRLDINEFKQAALHNQIVVQSFWKTPLH